ncbi:MAG: hypothetical protein K0M64_10120 [Rhizobium sp.]|nr:hypothetical protein [Rhizobium sp.]
MKNLLLGSLLFFALLPPAVAQVQVTPPAGKPRPATEAKPTAQATPAVQVRGDLRLAPLPDAARLQLSREQFERLRQSREQAQAEARTKAGKAPMTTRRPVQPTPWERKRINAGWTHRHAVGPDCDDRQRSVHPLAPEVCDNLDNNCDGVVDEGQRLAFFLDADGDTHGDPRQRVDACPADQQRAANEGRWLVPVGNDCDDTDPNRWQGCP